ncbi:MAG: hypothetical protein H6670_19890 [Anaerolineaceae bacterium]|nr:hypothetical protein [Anaerolineae bacterium]MCB9461922.1 hypothetical protein [Anaerolineaceae bacterium]
MNTGAKQYQYELTKQYQRENERKANQHRLAYESHRSEKYVSALPNLLERLMNSLASQNSHAPAERRQLRLRRRTT